MEYLYRKGRIVTITWKHGGQICKVLARPGQIVYDPDTNLSQILGEDKYVVYYEKLRINHADYMATLYNGTCTLFPGILVDAIHLLPSTVYEKKLRRMGIYISPFYNSEEPEGVGGEIISFKKLIYPFRRPRLVSIKRIIESNFPLFELSNGDVIERGSLKLFYRKASWYEQKLFAQKEINKNRERVFTPC